ncbi:MAG TPA: dihydropteroate synthase [Mycobacteriales bacterium]|nr:dihydropteroate synthase [Mycobacteriales bacterium]
MSDSGWRDSGPAFPSVRGLPGLPRCRIMAVINVTPDSFSDGGAFADADSAVKYGLALLAAGADILDVGGESTRPGAVKITAAEELRRVEPVVAALAEAGAIVSIDTSRASTAEAALRAGARVVNDVSGGAADPELPRLVADTGVPYVVMHNRGPSRDMLERAVYADVVNEVCAELRRAMDAVVDAGVDPGSVILDPGLGFAKLAEHNWALIAGLEAVIALGRPVLVGASRKSFLGKVLAAPDGADRPVSARDDATVAVTALAATAGAWGVRVHEVGPNLDAVKVAAAARAAASERTR